MGNKIGVIKQAASRIGCTVDEWISRKDRGETWCYCCKQWLSLEFFGVDKSRSNGRSSSCKKCTSHKGTASRYKLSVDQARDLRDGTRVCEICERTQKLEVDHSHATGEVRGVLCSRCNGALGQFCDDEKLLTKAIEYLRRKS
jgi:hypothetical protein